MNNGGNNAEQPQKEEQRLSDENGSSAGAVDIHPSESGKDTHAGHTPGKAEGVEAPELDGNQ